MEKLRGRVSSIRHTTDVVGSVLAPHVAIFELEGKPVKFSSNQPAIIKIGDEVVVAGKTNKGLFEADAYQNLTTDVNGHVGFFWLPLLLGAICVVGGVFAIVNILMLLSNILDAEGLSILMVVCGIVVVGCLMLYRATEVRKAIKSLE